TAETSALPQPHPQPRRQPQSRAHPEAIGEPRGARGRDHPRSGSVSCGNLQRYSELAHSTTLRPPAGTRVSREVARRVVRRIVVELCPFYITHPRGATPISIFFDSSDTILLSCCATALLESLTARLWLPSYLDYLPDYRSTRPSSTASCG